MKTYKYPPIGVDVNGRPYSKEVLYQPRVIDTNRKAVGHTPVRLQHFAFPSHNETAELLPAQVYS